MTPSNASSSASSSRRRGRWIPGRWMLAVLLLFLGLAAWIFFTSPFGDIGMRNVMTAMTVIATAGFYLLWLLLRSSLPLLTRVGIVGGLLLAVVAFFQLYRIDRVSGSMIPTFVARNAEAPDRALDRPPTASGEADLVTTTALDYPRFLGAAGDQRVRDARLDPDWEASPPQELWRQPIGAGWAGWAVVNGYALTLEQRGDEEWVTNYDLASGEVVWSYASPGRFSNVIAGVGPRTTPTVVDGKVVTLGALGHLAVLDGRTGQEIWARQLNEESGLPLEGDEAIYPYARSNSPLVITVAPPAATAARTEASAVESSAEEASAQEASTQETGEAPEASETSSKPAGQQLVVVPLGGPDDAIAATLAAFDLETGDEVWRAGEDQIGCASPQLGTLAGREVILSVNTGNVTAHDPATGAELFRHPWPGAVNGDCSVSQPRPLPDDRLFLSKGYGTGAALLQIAAAGERLEGTELWANQRVLRTKFTNVVFHQGHAYGLSEGILECVDLETGKRVWKRGRYGHGQILAADDLLLVLSEDGEVFLVRLSPDEPNQVLGSFEAVPGKTWNPLALSGSTLVVRNAEEASAWRLPLLEI
ncbi:MAG: PQQ-binding-like beta-propeller repeat protein [Acidobacteriota bacterium]